MKHSLLYYIVNFDKSLLGILTRLSPRYALMYDKKIIEHAWEKLTGKPLYLDDPQTYCEKLQWLKLYDRKPQYSILVDKYLVKNWIADKVGSKYVIPTLAVYHSAAEIDVDSLPEQFVIKCNHDSGSTIICRNKEDFDIEKAKMKLASALNKNHYKQSREWVYKNVKPVIIAEPLLKNVVNNENSAEDLWTYKFLCFNGVPKIMYVTVKNDDIWENYYDMDFKPLDIKRQYRTNKNLIPRPDAWEEMKHIAEVLSKDLPHVRVDLYCTDCGIKFSEMGFQDWSGYSLFPTRWEKKLGEWIVLPTQNKSF